MAEILGLLLNNVTLRRAQTALAQIVAFHVDTLHPVSTFFHTGNVSARLNADFRRTSTICFNPRKPVSFPAAALLVALSSSLEGNRDCA